MRITPTKTALALLAAMALAIAPATFAGHRHGHGGHHRHGHWHAGYRGHHGHRGGHHHHRYAYRHGHRDRLGQWIAGAVVATALAGIVADATAPQPYYDGVPPPPPPPRVTYRGHQAPTVIYQSGAPGAVQRRVPDTRVYNAPDRTRYIRDDGWDGHGN